jgi:transcriptional regulator with XRE-family HTH domain
LNASDQHVAMATRVRPGDQGAEDARRLLASAGREIRLARRSAGLSIAEAARRAGMSPSRFGRIERDQVRSPGFDALCRAARAVGLKPGFRLFPTGEPVVDSGQLPLLARFEAVLAGPLLMHREVALPIQGDLRAWDARVTNGHGSLSLDAEARIEDMQAVARRMALKQRDDPNAGVVVLLLNRTAANRRVLAEHREALRAQFPLDGWAILRELRAGRLPIAGGIVLI